MNAERWGEASSIRGVLVCLSMAMLMPSLGTSIANAGLPAMADAFHASFQNVQWIVLAYLLAITVATIVAGRLGDLMGLRRTLLLGISLFTGASLLCCIAPTLGFLIVARALQGIGAASMMALAFAFVGVTISKARTGSAMGLLGTMSAVGTTLGPSLGGILMAGFGWRMIFLINVPLGALSFFLAYRYLPTDSPRPRTERRVAFDYVGTFLLAAILMAYTLAMTMGRGHFGILNGMLLITALLGFGFFLLVEGRAASPLVRLAMFRNPGLSAGLALSALVSTVMMATLVVGPFYLAQGLGLGALHVGLALSAGPLVAALVGVPAGQVVDRFGAARMTVLGLAGMGAGAGVLSLLPGGLGVFGYLAPIVVMTAHYALFQTANNTAIMTGVSSERRGVVSGMLGLSRNLGLVTGASVLGAVFAVSSAARDISLPPSESIAMGMRVTFAVAAAMIAIALAVAIATRWRSFKT